MIIWIRYFAMHLKSHMQYKLSFALVTLGQFISSFTVYLSIYFMFTRFKSVEGFSYTQALLCYAVVLMGFSMAELFASGLIYLPHMLGNGEYDRALVRPRSVLMQVMLSKLDLSRVGILIQAVILLIYAIPSSGVSWTSDKVFTLCLMILSGTIVFYALFLLRAAISFFTIEGLEFLNIFTYGARQFGRYPFSIYGRGALAFVTYVIPVALFQYYPLLYLLSRETSAVYMLTPLFALWFPAPVYALYRYGQRKYKSTGS